MTTLQYVDFLPLRKKNTAGLSFSREIFELVTSAHKISN